MTPSSTAVSYTHLDVYKRQLRILLYQDRQQLPIQALLEKALGDNAAMLRSERTGMDVMVLTPGAVSAEAMLGEMCIRDRSYPV